VWPVASRVLLFCGPGNNGGDGLVAARHLFHFGFKPMVVYLRKEEPKKELYKNVLAQLDMLEIPIIANAPDDTYYSKEKTDVIVDALFGFSFDASGGIRAPYDVILAKIVKSDVAVASVDVPSGWHVEDGDIHKIGLSPEMLISLTAPKLCARHFTGPHHFLGGRFLPPVLREKYNLHNLPQYQGVAQCLRLEDEVCKI